MTAVNAPSRAKVVKHLGAIRLNYVVRINAAAANTTATLIETSKILQEWPEKSLYDIRNPVEAMIRDCYAINEAYKTFCKSDDVLILVTRLLEMIDRCERAEATAEYLRRQIEWPERPDVTGKPDFMEGSWRCFEAVAAIEKAHEVGAMLSDIVQGFDFEEN